VRTSENKDPSKVLFTPAAEHDSLRCPGRAAGELEERQLHATAVISVERRVRIELLRVVKRVRQDPLGTVEIERKRLVLHRRRCCTRIRRRLARVEERSPGSGLLALFSRKASVCPCVEDMVNPSCTGPLPELANLAMQSGDGRGKPFSTGTVSRRKED
jgi:hypothetical protein